MTPLRELFLVSCLALFFELACIRWFGSTVVFLTFFTNIVLLATFLGLSVGSLAASSRRDWSPSVVPLLLVTALLAYGSLWAYGHFGRVLVDVGGRGSPQQVYFGTEFRARDVASFAIPIELLGAVFFGLIAFVFVGVGQVIGRAFRRAPDPLRAYVSNIAGSVAGIAAFTLASYWRTTPMAWFAAVALMWACLLGRHTVMQVGGLIAIVAFAGFSGYTSTIWSPFQRQPIFQVPIWSPYYKIQYSPALKRVETNNIAHQVMVNVDEDGPAYQLPYLLNRDAGGRAFENVLVVGAGSGNDVSAALANGAKHVDAVEIDPSIADIGRAEHPNHPYQDPRVTVHVDDGRSFLRTTHDTYDLIVYALVDSLVLHSGYSNLRLESFLFTQQAFDDIAARLRPDGVFAAYNEFRQGWIVGRIDRMAERAFGGRPIVITLPHLDVIKASDQRSSVITFILTSRGGAALSAIRQRFRERQSFWANNRPSVNRALNGFGPEAPAAPGAAEADWNRIAPAVVDRSGIDRMPTDDWPFLYLRAASVPALNIRSIAILATLSVAILYMLRPASVVRLNWQMFFLGAGFMLIETKSVVHMALLFGSTWMVNAIVLFAILMMVLASALFVLAVKPGRLWPYYGLLFLSLAVDVAVPMSSFLALPGAQRVVASCAVVFAPIFFAGIAFAASFRRSTSPDVDFGSNIAGAMVGGLAESISLVVGFNNLLVGALIVYALSAALQPTTAAAPSAVAVAP